MFISLYTTRLILNALGASDFGIFNVVGGAIAMLGFLHAAMSGATQRFMSYYEGKGDKEIQKHIFNVSSVLHFGIALILALILFVAGFFFFNGILNIADDRIFAAKVIYGSLILSTVFTVMSVPYEAVLNAHENMLYYSIVGVIESLLNLAVALIIVHFAGDKLILYGILMATIPFVSRTIMQIYCRRKYSECVIAPRRYWDATIMKEMTSFAGWSFSSSASSMVGNYGVGVVLNNFFGTVLNASYGIAAQLNGQLLAFSNTMLKALNPAIVKAEGGGERQSMIKLSLMGCKYSFLLLSFFAIPFLLETPIILKLWLKNVPDWAVIFCRLAILRTMIEQLTLPLNTAIGAQGEIKSFSIVNTALSLIPLPLIYILFLLGFPPYSMLIVTLIIGGIANGIVSLLFAVNRCDLLLSDYVNRVIKKIVILFLISLTIGFIPILFLNESIIRLILVVIFSMFTFILMFYMTGFSEEEKIYFNIILNKIKYHFLKVNNQI